MVERDAELTQVSFVTDKLHGGQPDRDNEDTEAGDQDKTKGLSRQGTVGKLIKIHGKMSGDMQGWIDEELDVKENAEGEKDVDKNESEVQGAHEVRPKYAHLGPHDLSRGGADQASLRTFP